ncbi:hypothetical protein [Candidatus Palauibacter sp.]|uniref:hypothetical protein n=1 Tax=Candidatus Palauibacter sp. TaxID=3101350 RepID=UPI003B023F4A
MLRPLPDGGVLVLDPYIRRITHLSAAWEPVRLTDIGARFATNFVPLASGSGFVLAGWGRTDDSERAEITQAIDLDGNALEMIAAIPKDDAMRRFFPSPLATG